MELLMAIALLCGNPVMYKLDTPNVLACQKYYVQCMSKKNVSSFTTNAPNMLSDCIMKKQKLGGDK